MRVQEKHTNARGTLHGGVLASIADIALGYGLATSTKPPTSMVTANLSVDFAGSAQIGDWVETSLDIQKIGSRMAFANVYFSVERRAHRARQRRVPGAGEDASRWPSFARRRLLFRRLDAEPLVHERARGRVLQVHFLAGLEVFLDRERGERRFVEARQDQLLLAGIGD